MNKRMRAEFEAYVWTLPETKQFMFSWYCGEYSYRPVQYRWEGWQASRQALEVELPSGFYCEAGYSRRVLDLEGTESAIRVAGIRIKGAL